MVTGCPETLPSLWWKFSRACPQPTREAHESASFSNSSTRFPVGVQLPAHLCFHVAANPNVRVHTEHGHGLCASIGLITSRLGFRYQRRTPWVSRAGDGYTTRGTGRSGELVFSDSPSFLAPSG